MISIFRTQWDRLTEKDVLMNQQNPEFGRYEVSDQSGRHSIFDHPEILGDEFYRTRIVLGDRHLIRAYIEGRIDYPRVTYYYASKSSTVNKYQKVLLPNIIKIY